MKRVPIIEVGDHSSDVFFVPLDGIDDFLHDNRRDYHFGLGEMSAELGTLTLNLAGASKTIQPTNAAGEALFVKSSSSPSVNVKSVVMAPKVAVAPPKPAPPPPPPPPPAPTPAPKPTTITGVLQSAASAASNLVKQAVDQALTKPATNLATTADSINKSIASLVGQQNKAPAVQIATSQDTGKSSSGFKLTLGGSAKFTTGNAKPKLTTPSVGGALSAAVDAAKKAVATPPAPAKVAVTTPVTTSTPDPNAVFVPQTPVNIKAVVAAEPLTAAKKVLDAQILPPATVTSKIDVGPYLVMKPTVEPLTAAKAAEVKPLEIVSKVASLAPVVSSLHPSTIKALADAAKGVERPSAAVSTLLSELSTVGGPEKCACIVARKKPGLAALGVQTPTLRSKLPTKTFVASSRVDYQGQVLDALHQIERNTSNEQLRERLRNLRIATGVR